MMRFISLLQGDIFHWQGDWHCSWWSNFNRSLHAMFHLSCAIVVCKRHFRKMYSPGALSCWFFKLVANFELWQRLTALTKAAVEYETMFIKKMKERNSYYP